MFVVAVPLKLVPLEANTLAFWKSAVPRTVSSGRVRDCETLEELRSCCLLRAVCGVRLSDVLAE